MKPILFFCFLFLWSCQDQKPAEISSPVKPDHSLAELAYQHTEEILKFGPRPAGSKELSQVRAYLSTQLQDRGWKVKLQRVTRSTPKGSILFQNLRARHSSAPDWEAPTKGLLCCHIDSKEIEGIQFLGADDAASSAGMILALLDHFPIELLSQLELAFFDGEEAIGNAPMSFENGLYGSKAYARLWAGKQNKPEFGLLLDMIGHQNLKLVYPSDSPPSLSTLLVKSAKEAQFSEVLKKHPGAILDDHVPLNLAGIPTIDLIGDFTASPWWHQKEDNLELISLESLAISGEIIQNFLLKRLGSEQAPSTEAL